MTLPRFFVYGLYDPAKPDVVRYVGAASVSERPLQHALEARQQSARKTHKLNWIRSLGDHGYRWRVLRRCDSWEETMAAEKETIAGLHARGVRLTNGTGGGEGFFCPTPEVKLKCAAAIRVAHARPETKARLIAAAKARRADPATRAKYAVTLASPEYRARMSEIAKRVNASRDVRMKMLVAHGLAWENPKRKARQASVMRAYHERCPGRACSNGKKAMHVRWHERRGVEKPGCQFCEKAA